MKSRAYKLSARFLMLALLLGSGSAGAAKKKSREKIKPPVSQATEAQKKELGALMGAFSFGMTKDEVMGKLKAENKERYQEKIAAVSEAFQQDNLRKERDKEVKRIQDSFISFEGKRSGWDVSIVDDQFGHNTGESMLEYWENVDGKDQRRFFFFHEGKLYKMFIALNSGMLKENQKSFAFFQDLMEKRFGRGQVLYTTDKDGVEHPTGLTWRSSKYLVSAYDKLGFYGSFCLSIAEPGTETRLAEARKAKLPQPKKDTVIETVVQKDKEKDNPSLDENAGAVDAVIGD